MCAGDLHVSRFLEVSSLFYFCLPQGVRRECQLVICGWQMRDIPSYGLPRAIGLFGKVDVPLSPIYVCQGTTCFKIFGGKQFVYFCLPQWMGRGCHTLWVCVCVCVCGWQICEHYHIGYIKANWSFWYVSNRPIDQLIMCPCHQYAIYWVLTCFKIFGGNWFVLSPAYLRGERGRGSLRYVPLPQICVLGTYTPAHFTHTHPSTYPPPHKYKHNNVSASCPLLNKVKTNLSKDIPCHLYNFRYFRNYLI